MSKWNTTDKELLEQDLYIVYEIFQNGSKRIYKKSNGYVDFIFSKNQARGVIRYLNKQGLGYEIHKAQLNLIEQVEEI